MLLIIEQAEDVQFIVEDDEKTKKKQLYIEGVFCQYDIPNRNGRIYPKVVMENEVNRYIKEHINMKRAYGELNHPQGPQINLDKVSHLIEKLEMRHNGSVLGRAKIVDTPMGNIAKGLIEGGASLGVSTRGLGSLKESSKGLKEVQNDFRLVTAADIVADPSAPAAFVNGIMENANWVLNEKTGEWIQEAQQQIRKLSRREIEEQQYKLFKSYIKTLLS